MSSTPRVADSKWWRRILVIVASTSAILAISLATRNVPSVLTAAAVITASSIAALSVLSHLIDGMDRRNKDRDVRRLQLVQRYGEPPPIIDKESGLYAQWYFGLRLKEEIARANRYGGRFALLFIEVGEPDLATTQERILLRTVERNLRQTDIAAYLRSLRFALLLPNTDDSGAVAASQRLRDSLAPNRIRAGLACYPDDGTDVRSLLTAAGPSPDAIDEVLTGVDSVTAEGMAGASLRDPNVADAA